MSTGIERGVPLDDCMSFVGKKAAGKLLDGKMWQEFPGSASQSQPDITEPAAAPVGV